MKNLKNLIIILFFLSLFHICCKSNSNPITLSYYVGKWHNVEDNTLIITIYSDGSMTEGSGKKIPASDITRISATSYKAKQGGALYFRSFTKGTFTLQEDEGNPISIVRK